MSIIEEIDERAQELRDEFMQICNEIGKVKGP